MKTYTYLVGLILFFSLSCSKETNQFKVFKNEQGNVYLVNSPEYLFVCNANKFDNYNSGDIVMVKFNRFEAHCKKMDHFCTVGNPENGYVEVKKIY